MIKQINISVYNDQVNQYNIDFVNYVLIHNNVRKQ